MNKKSIYILTFIFIFIFAKCNEKTTNEIPIITIDDNHYNLRKARDGIIPTENYKIKACNSFNIDATKYDFSIIKKMNNGNLPSMIQIISKKGTFVVDLDTEYEITVDEKTAENIGGNEIFNGFEKGEKVLIGLGTLYTEKNNVEFKTFWTTFIEFE